MIRIVLETMLLISYLQHNCLACFIFYFSALERFVTLTQTHVIFMHLLKQLMVSCLLVETVSVSAVVCMLKIIIRELTEKVERYRLFLTLDSKAYCSPSVFVPASFRSERDGGDLGNTLLLALTWCRLWKGSEAKGFSPAPPCLNCFIAQLWKQRGKTHGTPSKLFGMDIKNTLRCQFQFPHRAQDIDRDSEPGLVLVVVQ